MAIAHVAAGTRLKADVSLTGSPQSVALPAGHVSGHWLLLVVVTEDNTGPTSAPAGWSSLGSYNPGNSTNVPYAGLPHVWLYHRIDDGTLGSTVSVSFSTEGWPTGNPYVLAWTEAWSGLDTTAPVESVNGSSTTSTAAAFAHPQMTTIVNDDWLITLRAVGADSAKTFTDSGGTNTERVDDSHGSPAAPSAALYDAGPLSPGLQTQRTTTASATVEYGSVGVSIVLKVASSAGATTALAQVATVTATANDASVTSEIGPWDLCGVALPSYSFAVDWDADGSLVTTGSILNTNPYTETDISDWNATNATIVWSEDLVVPSLKLTTSAGTDPRAASGQQAVITGQTYRAVGWLYAPAILPTNAAVNINWYDASHVYLSTSTNSAALTAGVWTHFDMAFTAPASAAFASDLMAVLGTPGAGHVLYGYGILLIDSSDTSSLITPGPGENIRPDIIGEVGTTYGRDQNRQLNPAAVGSAAFAVINVDRQYSPEWMTSPLFGDLEPARTMVGDVTFGGATYPIFNGRIDDYDLRAEFTDRTVDFTFLDGLNDLSGTELSTEVYQNFRTGELIDIILDLVGWTAARDIDYGATVVPFWWVERVDAFTAINDLVKSEGPPAIAYVAPDGTFVYRDRHHRIQRSESITSQATFSQGEAFGCDSPAVPEGFDFTAPFEYSHGWRDIVNSVVFDVEERSPDISLSAVWTTDDQFSIAIGQSVELEITTGDPFIEAITPVSGTDFIATGAGVVNVTLSRTSGESTKITFLAVGGSVVISDIQLRARAIPVRRTIKVSKMDTGSITNHGERAYPEEAPWAGANDSSAIADMILLQYSRRRPTVLMRIVTQDPAHFVQILQRSISDRIHLVYNEIGLDADFFIERVTHTITRFNQTGLPPVHSVVFGCEKELQFSANPFRFDVRGAGFDEGVFDPLQVDNASTVFTFDHPVQGQFDTGLFGT